MLEDRRAVQSDARRAEQGELDRLHIAFLAARRVGGRAVDRADFAVGKGFGIEFRRVFGIAFVPQAEGYGGAGHLHSPFVGVPIDQRWPNGSLTCPSRSPPDRTRVVQGKSVSVPFDLGVLRILPNTPNHSSPPTPPHPHTT